MKFAFDKEWLERYANGDENLEIAAGDFSLDQLPPAANAPIVGKPDPVAFERLSREEHPAIEEAAKYFEKST